MKKVFIHIFLLLFVCHLNAQNPGFSREAAMDYITVYYDVFYTGYDFDGDFVTLTTNYKATFSHTVFTLTFDSLDENNKMQPQIITFDLKNVTSMGPSVTAIVEIVDVEIIRVPISQNIAFNTPEEKYYITVFFDGNLDLVDSEIYAAFSQLIVDAK
jgi:hypothetical protein